MPDEDQGVALLLWKESMQQALSARCSLREAALDLGSQPRFYTQLLKLPGRCWLRPVRRHRIVRAQQLLRNIDPTFVSDSHPLVTEIEDHLMWLEFGGKHLPPSLRTRLRRAAVANGIAMWRVRSAFKSMAVVKSRSGVLVRRAPSPWLRNTFTLGREFSVGLLLAILAYVIQAIVLQECVDCTAISAIFAANLLVVVTALLTVLGPDWEAGDKLLSLIGAPRTLSL